MIELLRNYPFPFKLKNKLRNQDGFIAIMALGLFALLAVFSFIVSGIFRSTVRSIQDTNDYLAAQDLNNSIAEFILFDLNSRGPGYNSGVVICEFDEDGELSNASLDEAESQEISDYCTNNFGDILPDGKEVRIEFAVQGRGDEEIVTQVCESGLFNTDISPCYSVPRKQYGNATWDCEDYPTPDASGIISVEGDSIDQLDYECNWNILQVGNASNTMVRIPLYYDNNNIAYDEPEVAPFHEDNAGAFNATEGIILKVRTPCSDINPVCDDADRYEIGGDPDDEVVKWWLSGQCDGVECSFTPIEGSSVITANKVNTELPRSFSVIGNDAEVSNDTVGLNDVISEPQVFNIANLTDGGTGEYNFALVAMDEPYLNLEVDTILTDSTTGEVIPYLEYQLLTSKPVADIKTIIKIVVEVEGNVSMRRYQLDSTTNSINAVLDF